MNAACDLTQLLLYLAETLRHARELVIQVLQLWRDCGLSGAEAERK